AEHSHPLYTLSDARSLRNALLERLEAAAAADPPPPGAPLDIVVIGGGATGVEVAGSIVELLDISVQHDRVPIDRGRTTVTLVDTLDRLLAAFDEPASAYARSELERRGITVRLGTSVAEVTATSVLLTDGSSL